MTYRRGSDDTFGQILIALIVIMAVFIGGRACDDFKCGELEANTGRATRFDVLSGCYVDVGGHWVPADRWRVVDP